MKFSLKQVAVFDAIADSGSVSQAAETLSMTQSAASMALSQLEGALGKQLFERQGKKLVLNQWGYWLRPRVKNLLSDVNQIEQGFSGQHLLSGDLNLGVSQTIAEHLIPDLISELDHDFPQLRINLIVENSEHVIDGLLDYRYELGVIEGRCDDERLMQNHWCKDHMLIVASPHHPYASQDAVSLTQLEEARWVLREQGSGTRDVFDSIIHQRIERLDVWREYDYVPVLIALVCRGQYLSCLPQRSVQKAIEAGELVALNTPDLAVQRSFSFIWRKGVTDNPLRDFVIKRAKRMIR